MENFSAIEAKSFLGFTPAIFAQTNQLVFLSFFIFYCALGSFFHKVGRKPWKWNCYWEILWLVNDPIDVFIFVFFTVPFKISIWHKGHYKWNQLLWKHIFLDPMFFALLLHFAFMVGISLSPCCPHKLTSWVNSPLIFQDGSAAPWPFSWVWRQVFA